MMFALAIALATAAPSAAMVDRRPPIDQCASDRSFVAFRNELRRAIRRRDRRYLLSILAPDVGVSLGGARGERDFIAQWHLDRSDTLLWPSLEAALSLGCARLENGELVAPSLVAQLDDQEDASSAVVAIRTGASARARPDETSEAIATLAWDVLRLRSVAVSEGWYPVTLASGREGFVRHADVRGPLDYRAYFRKHRGRWRMTAFVAGD
jgi:hypothetical protein